MSLAINTKKVVAVYKPVALTPLQLVQQFRCKYPEYKTVKISYAGRLDPMAHGITILLIGEENKNRQKYLSLDKKYEFTVLFGVQTDSYDFLGLIQDIDYQMPPTNLKPKIEQFIQRNLGKQTQAYPPYSTKTVQGKPLFKWAREGRVSEIELPTREVEIYSLDLLAIEEISKESLEKQILDNIQKLEGDFRQNEIAAKWKNFFDQTLQKEFITAKFRVSCSSGTYVRNLANNLGGNLGCGAITIEINRKRIGEYALGNFG